MLEPAVKGWGAESGFGGAVVIETERGGERGQEEVGMEGDGE